MKGINTGLLCLVLAGAAWTDALDKKVRNWWLFMGAAGGIWCRGAEFFPGALVVLLAAFFLFRLRVMGAGDGKLMAVMAGYLGLDAGLEAIFFGMAVGAIWSLCRLRHSRSLKTYLIHLAVCFTQEFQTRKINECEGGMVKSPMGVIPLAPCMAAGTYLYLMITGAMAVWGKNL